MVLRPYRQTGETMLLTRLSALTLPLLLALIGVAALHRKQDVFGTLTRGAAAGLKTVAGLAPTLVALLCAVQMLRASGAFDLLASLLRPAAERCGIPGELIQLILIRPFSGSGALAAATDIMQTTGADSLAGRMAAVMLASSETALYTAGVYFGAAGVRRTRYAIPAAFAAECTAFLAAAATVRLFWD